LTLIGSGPPRPTDGGAAGTRLGLERDTLMLVFAHHMAVEILGREFSPHGVVQHVCVFAALGLIMATSLYGTWALGMRLLGGRQRQGT
jgi:hypothetical protein